MFAATGILSSEMSYTNAKNEDVESVKDALDDLYSKASCSEQSENDTNIFEFSSHIFELVDTNDHIYYHDGTLTQKSLGIGSGTSVLDANDGSYRYSGSNEIVNDNYVCFGYTDVSVCSSDNFATSDYAYRIIGIFDKGNCSSNAYTTRPSCEKAGLTWNSEHQVKIIKVTPFISNAYTTNWLWSGTSKVNNNPNNSYLLNNYEDSVLFNEVLNGTGTTTEILKYNATEVTTVKTFLGNLDNKWQEMLATPTWYVGGNTNNKINYTSPGRAYNNEIEYDSTNNNLVGLIYPSEYGFGSSPEYWNLPLFATSNNDYRTAINDNWLFFNGTTGLTITRVNDSSNSYYEDKIYVVTTTGWVGIGSCYKNEYYYIHPTFYLESNVEVSGSGEIDNPYVLSVR